MLASMGRRIRGLLFAGGVSDIPAGTLEAAETAAGGRALCCLRAEKVFLKKSSSLTGETFFKNIAVVTDRRLVVLRESSRAEVGGFALADVAGCAALSDSGKPALTVNFSDGSQARLVFSSGDPAIDIFKNALAVSAAPEGKVCSKCGKAGEKDARFCSACGAALDFAASENTL